MDIRIGDAAVVKEDVRAGIVAGRVVVIAVNCENGEGIPTEIVVKSERPLRLGSLREINRVAPDQIEVI